MVVSDQRCHGAARPAMVTEPCNAECEIRYCLNHSQSIYLSISQIFLSLSVFISVICILFDTKFSFILSASFTYDLSCLCRWHVARKSECTVACGVGYRTLEIYCAKLSRADGKTQKVDERYCSSQRKPDDKESCHGDCNPAGWEYSSWSEVRPPVFGWAKKKRRQNRKTKV